MKNINEESLPAGTTALFCEYAQMVAARTIRLPRRVGDRSLIYLPGLLIWFGWPTLSVTEVCDELMKVRWSDDKAMCLVPHPLYGANEGEGRTTGPNATAQDEWGIQPRPLYKRIGYRDLVQVPGREVGA